MGAGTGKLKFMPLGSATRGEPLELPRVHAAYPPSWIANRKGWGGHLYLRAVKWRD